MLAFVAYRRCRFAARFPVAPLYTPAHFWLRKRTGGIWRVGLTPFGSRLVGEVVELEIRPHPGTVVACDEILGFVEGFKGITDIRSVGSGAFRRANPALADHPDLVNEAPQGRGWLYEFAGEAGPGTMDVTAYCVRLDGLIDRMGTEPDSCRRSPNLRRVSFTFTVDAGSKAALPKQLPKELALERLPRYKPEPTHAGSNRCVPRRQCRRSPRW